MELSDPGVLAFSISYRESGAEFADPLMRLE